MNTLVEQATSVDRGEPGEFGRLLRQWRRARGMSQFELASRGGVSARHISFLETGRSGPSREMVLILSTALRVPLRDRNSLLQAGGHLPLYTETNLEDPQMADMLQALKLILRQQGPGGGAVAFDRGWDIVMASESFTRFLRLLLDAERVRIDPLAVVPAPRPNLLRLLFDPRGLRPHILNWEAVAREFLARLTEELAWSRGAATKGLLETVLAYPGVPTEWRDVSYGRTSALVTAIEVATPKGTIRLFSTLTTLGTPRDITLQELRIESFHAADENSRRIVGEILGVG